MDEQNTQEEDELFATTSTDDADTSAADTDEQKSDSKDEQKQDALEADARGKADIARDEQAEGWARKIASGEKSLDEMPANLKWLKPFVEAKLVDKSPDFEKLIDKKFSEREEANNYNSLVQDVNSMDLSSSQKIALNEKNKFFKAKGLSRLDALEAAMETLNINPQEAALEKRRQSMRLRTPGFYAKTGETSPDKVHEEAGYAEVAKSLTPEKRLAYLRGLKKY